MCPIGGIGFYGGGILEKNCRMGGGGCLHTEQLTQSSFIKYQDKKKLGLHKFSLAVSSAELNINTCFSVTKFNNNQSFKES